MALNDELLRRMAMYAIDNAALLMKSTPEQLISVFKHMMTHPSPPSPTAPLPSSAKDWVDAQRWIDYEQFAEEVNSQQISCAFMGIRSETKGKVCGAPAYPPVDLSQPLKWRCKTHEKAKGGIKRHVDILTGKTTKSMKEMTPEEQVIEKVRLQALKKKLKEEMGLIPKKETPEEKVKRLTLEMKLKEDAGLIRKKESSEEKVRRQIGEKKLKEDAGLIKKKLSSPVKEEMEDAQWIANMKCLDLEDFPQLIERDRILLRKHKDIFPEFYNLLLKQEGSPSSASSSSTPSSPQTD
jgi:hypothetical protein